MYHSQQSMKQTASADVSLSRISVKFRSVIVAILPRICSEHIKSFSFFSLFSYGHEGFEKKKNKNILRQKLLFSFKLLVKYRDVRNIIISSRERFIWNEFSVGRREIWKILQPLWADLQSAVCLLLSDKFRSQVMLVTDGSRIVINENKQCTSLKMHYGHWH
jgi:hypothetical protein